MRAAFVVIVAVVAGATPAAGQPLRAAPERSPLVTLLKIGSESVRDSYRVTLPESVVDVFGEGVNTHGRKFVALVRPARSQHWLATGYAFAEPGGVFTIRGVRFPRPGDFELIVAVVESGTTIPDGELEEHVWRAAALTLSPRISITILDGAATLARQRADSPETGPSLISFANVALQTGETTAVPPTGTLVVEAPAIRDRTRPYAIVRVPATDRAVVVGPGHPANVPGRYMFTGLTLVAPGDPQQTHLELTAFTTDAPVRAGPVSWAAFSQWPVRLSLPAGVVVGAGPTSSGFPPLALIAISRVGRHPLAGAGRVVNVVNGCPVAVTVQEGAFEGDQVTILTRRSGSRVFRAHGPAVRQALAWDPHAQRQRVVYVWLDLRFERGPEDASNSQYEIVAVLTPSPMPRGPIDASFLASISVHALSEPVYVHVDGADEWQERTVAIASVQDVRAARRRELSVGARGPVTMATPGGRPDGFFYYVARSKPNGGTTTFQLYEAMDRGKTQIVPDVPVTDTPAVDGAKSQLIGLLVSGRLHTTELSYDDLIRHATAVSDVVNVRYSSGFGAGFTRLIPAPLRYGLGQPVHAAEPSRLQEGETLMSALSFFIPLVLLAAIAYALAKLAGGLPAGAGWRFRSRTWFEMGVPRFLLGIALCILFVWAIQQHYLPVYAQVLATVMSLDADKSVGLAVWLIVLTALLGIFTDVSLDFSRLYKAKGELLTSRIYLAIAAGCLFVAVVLWLFQGGLYFSMLSLDSYGIVPMLGGVAFTLVAVVETITFFFITKLSLPAVQFS